MPITTGETFKVTAQAPPRHVIVRESRISVVRSTSVERIAVTAQGIVGPQGPPGEQGPAGGDTHTYVQSTPSAGWVIQHSFGRRVQVTLFDAAGEEIYADVSQVTNQVSVSFPAPFTGSALLS